jgi:hypothetical protein
MKLNAAFVSIGFAILVQACEGEPIENGLLPPPGGGTSAPLGFRLGASGVDQINGVVVDPAGNVYVAGTFTASVDFNLGTGIAGLTSQGGPDGFLAKYTGTGGFVWAVRFGGTEAETVSALARDGAGNLYVGGGFGGTTRFDTPGGAQTLISAGGTDGYVAKFTTDGNFVWARRFGSTSTDEVADLAVDASGNVYAVGAFAGQADALPAAGATIVSNGSDFDGFVLSLDGSGAVRWAFSLGGTQADSALAVRVTSDGAVAVAGTFTGNADFAPDTATSGLAAVGGTDVFLASYSTAGALSWVRRIGGLGDEAVARGGLAADATGGIAATGKFTGSVDFDPGAGVATRTSVGSSDVYVVRLDGTGAFQSVFTLGGGTGTPAAAYLAFGADGNLLVTGAFAGSVDFNPGAGTLIITSFGTGGGTDVFVARYTPVGGLLWVSRFGDAANGAGNANAGAALAPAASGAVFVVGQFFGTPDFNPGSGNFSLTSLGDSDGFLVKLAADGSLVVP